MIALKIMLLKLIFFFVRPCKQIILESHPDFSCNTYEVYKYMLKKGFNNEYKIIWLVDNPQKYKNIKEHNVFIYDLFPKGRLKRFKQKWLIGKSIAVIYCNRLISKTFYSSKQLNLYLDHGSPMKAMIFNSERVRLHCDYLISQSQFFNEYIKKEYTINGSEILDSQIICTGIPRNDQLFRSSCNMKKIWNDFSNYNKKIVWAPTFRKKKNSTRIDCSVEQPYGFPILYSESDIRRLQKVLEDTNTLLVLKPHPVQDFSALKRFLSNHIRLLDNEKMYLHEIQTNEMLSQMDAMITDYSSIYYDFLLLDRPIAVSVDDFDEYNKQKGFVFDNPLDILKGKMLFNIDDLICFIEEVSKNIDSARDERQKIKCLTNEYFDDKSAERVYNFILSKIDDVHCN